MTAAVIDVRQATEDDVSTVVEILTEGFLDGDFAEWLIPDPQERARVYPHYFQILAEHALNAGWVHLAGTDGVAVWYDSAGPEAPIPDYPRRLAEAVGEALPRFQTMDEEMEKAHPGARHHYLSHLAVRPNRRGHGIGTALLKHHHWFLDRRQIPAYLEATGNNNQRLYERHGYQRHHPIFGFGLSAPKVRPMWRDPRADVLLRA